MPAENTSEIIASVPKHLRAFQLYNQSKLNSSLKDFSDEQKDVFHLVPYLIHTANPSDIGCPGKMKAPAGIKYFNWKKDIQKLFQKHFGKREKFDLKTTDNPPPIEFMSVMGSIGTIAYTTRSDFDYWCCINPDLSGSQRELLQEKFIKIEEWCQSELGVEIHFFMTTEKDLKENNFGSVTKESCGSALGKLLKEEYFRGSIHIAGRIPFWWVFPVGLKDDLYEDCMQVLYEQEHAYRYEFIDIGNIVDIPYSEFLGGGLWQINKGIDYAFKSTLKMALLLEYLDPDSEKELLATQLKRKVHANPDHLEFLDSYQLMIDRVLDYYQRNDDKNTMELLRKCFFLKIKPSVSRWWRSPNAPTKTSDAVMLNYCQKWFWILDEVRAIENFNIMNIQEAASLKSQIENFMLSSLKKIISISKNLDISHSMDPKDMSRMQNRLIAIFDSSRPKSDWFYPPFDKFIHHQSYTFRYIEESGQNSKWILYKGEHDLKSDFGRIEEKNQIKESKFLPHLILWLIHNQCIDGKSQLFIHLQDQRKFNANIKALAEHYNTGFGGPSIPSFDSGKFLESPKACQWIISINLIPSSYKPSIENDFSLTSIEEAETEMTDYEDEKNFQETFTDLINDLNDPITSTTGTDEPKENFQEIIPNVDTETVFINDEDSFFETETSWGTEEPTTLKNNKRELLFSHEDPLNAWENKVSLLYSAHVIEKNTWGEVEIKEYTGVNWLAKAYAQVLTLCLQNNIDPEKEIIHHIGRTEYDPLKLKKRYLDCIRQMFEVFVRKHKQGEHPIPVYFFRLGGATHSLLYISGKVRSLHFPSKENAMVATSLHCLENMNVHYDKGTPLGAFYQCALEQAKTGMVNIAFQMTRSKAHFIIIDEIGHTTVCSYDRGEFKSVLPRLIFSVLVCIKRVSQFNPDSPLHHSKERFNTIWIRKDKEHRTKIKNITGDCLQMVRPVIGELNNTSLTLSASCMRSFLMLHTYNGSTDFNDKNVDIHYQETLDTLIQNSQQHLSRSRQKYRAFLCDLNLESGTDTDLEIEDKHFLGHVASWLNVKFALENSLSKDMLARENPN